MKSRSSNGARVWAKILVIPFFAGGLCVRGWAAPGQTVNETVRAIEQAPDPSAVIAAYADGFALDRNDPKLHEAYVRRMVDLGLPEIAYHQAETLTTLQVNNGLAWGVVAYVDARRAQMPEAISAVDLAGQFAPDDKFVQRTVGELVAWYDLKADKNTIPDSTKEGLARVRSVLETRPAFSEAYSTAQKAYQAQASGASEAGPGSPTQGASPMAAAAVSPNASQATPQTAAPVAPQAQADLIAPLGYSPPAPAPVYYPDYSYSSPYDTSGAYLDWAPDYCYDWGPGWVAPAPWWWWQPCGFWSGCGFYPFGASFVFGDFDHDHHFGHDGQFGHGGHFGHDGGFSHGDAFGRGHDPGLWHHDSQGRNNFFGTPARPSGSVAQWARAGSQTSAATGGRRASGGGQWWNSAGHAGSLGTAGVRASSSQPSTLPNRWTQAGTSVSAGRIGAATQTYWGRPSPVTRGTTAAPPVSRSWSGTANSYRAAPSARGWGFQNYARNYAAPRSTWTAPSYRAPYTAPHYSMPSSRSYGWHGGSTFSAPRSFGGFGGPRSSGSFGGGFHSGGFGGGGFHGGGGFSGGGHGGGHR